MCRCMSILSVTKKKKKCQYCPANANLVLLLSHISPLIAIKVKSEIYWIVYGP